MTQTIHKSFGYVPFPMPTAFAEVDTRVLSGDEDSHWTSILLPVTRQFLNAFSPWVVKHAYLAREEYELALLADTFQFATALLLSPDFTDAACIEGLSRVRRFVSRISRVGSGEGSQEFIDLLCQTPSLTSLTIEPESEDEAETVFNILHTVFTKHVNLRGKVAAAQALSYLFKGFKDVTQEKFFECRVMEDVKKMIVDHGSRDLEVLKHLLELLSDLVGVDPDIARSSADQIENHGEFHNLEFYDEILNVLESLFNTSDVRFVLKDTQLLVNVTQLLVFLLNGTEEKGNAKNKLTKEFYENYRQSLIFPILNAVPMLNKDSRFVCTSSKHYSDIIDQVILSQNVLEIYASQIVMQEEDQNKYPEYFVDVDDGEFSEEELASPIGPFRKYKNLVKTLRGRRKMIENGIRPDSHIPIDKICSFFELLDASLKDAKEQEEELESGEGISISDLIKESDDFPTYRYSTTSVAVNFLPMSSSNITDLITSYVGGIYLRALLLWQQTLAHLRSFEDYYPFLEHGEKHPELHNVFDLQAKTFAADEYPLSILLNPRILYSFVECHRHTLAISGAHAIARSTNVLRELTRLPDLAPQICNLFIQKTNLISILAEAAEREDEPTGRMISFAIGILKNIYRNQTCIEKDQFMKTGTEYEKKLIEMVVKKINNTA